ncbi:PREDICTED: uncharacterized protein At4g26485-like [Ipomoea nil]|uniref:uncharacterized protein At4g26485-like n=1 Tax=Ipomoea nil TaxID=35883 RepID=UPI000901C161|nr:PREDICTED: uncharacterized protein At4g26485-like [Ipomoea nil]
METISEGMGRLALSEDEKWINEGEEIEEEEKDEMVNKSKELEDDEEKGEEMVNKVGGVVLGKDAKWIKHYSSSQKILLVGEGDFSFSAALATAFGDASNMVATSLNSHGFLAENYKNALPNVDMLTNKGCTVMHGVDVRIMAYNALLRLEGLTFDRIVFNFPFARLSKKSPSPSIQCQQGLVRAFLKNAVKMIGEDGEIHITHKTNGSHIYWDITGLAYKQGLELVKYADFRLEDYPGYNTKFGFGGDRNFNCYPSTTYMFRLSDDGRGSD